MPLPTRDTNDVNTGGDWDGSVAAAGETLAEVAARVRAETAAAAAAARAKAAARSASGGVADALTAARAQARERVRTVRARGRDRVPEAGGAGAAGAVPTAGGLRVHDAHTVERLLSHVRHSVVRVCFYNLKLFSGSLVDEYDAQVRGQVCANLAQLPAVRRELEAFFGVALAEDRRVAGHFPGARAAALEALEALESLSAQAAGRIDEPAVRAALAEAAPRHIDAVMAALEGIQRALDASKLAVGEVLEEAVALAGPAAAGAGLEIRLKTGPAPGVFAGRGALLSVFGELIANAARYSGGTVLTIGCAASPDRLYVEAVFEDNGQGMAPELAARCVERGVTTGGTGEGLAMVVERIEGEHLGEFRISAAPSAGCRAAVRLPVKYTARERSA